MDILILLITLVLEFSLGLCILKILSLRNANQIWCLEYKKVKNMLSKKHFIAIAKIIRQIPDAGIRMATYESFAQ